MFPSQVGRREFTQHLFLLPHSQRAAHAACAASNEGIERDEPGALFSRRVVGVALETPSAAGMTAEAYSSTLFTPSNAVTKHDSCGNEKKTKVRIEDGFGPSKGAESRQG